MWTLIPILLVASQGQQTVDSLEKGVIAYRKTLNEGRVEMSIFVKKDQLQPVSESGWQKLVLYSKNGNLRGDLENRRFAGTDLHQTILTDKQLIEQRTNHEFTYVTPRDKKTQNSGDVFDPRLLGTFATPTMGLHQHDLQSIFKREKREVTAVLDPQEKPDTWRIERKFADKDRTAVSKTWIVPSMNYAVKKIESTSLSNARSLAFEMNAEYQQFGPNKTWYPKRVVYKRWMNNVLMYHEETVVDETRFGSVVDDSVFSLRALNLPAGRKIVTPGRIWIWDGD